MTQHNELVSTPLHLEYTKACQNGLVETDENNLILTTLFMKFNVFRWLKKSKSGKNFKIQFRTFEIFDTIFPHFSIALLFASVDFVLINKSRLRSLESQVSCYK